MNTTAIASETLGLGLEHSTSKLFNTGKLKKLPRTPTVLKKMQPWKKLLRKVQIKKGKEERGIIK